MRKKFKTILLWPIIAILKLFVKGMLIICSDKALTNKYLVKVTAYIDVLFLAWDSLYPGYSDSKLSVALRMI